MPGRIHQGSRLLPATGAKSGQFADGEGKANGGGPVRWADDRRCGFDIETTGEDRETARVVTATLVFVGGGRPTETVCLLADPDVEIPAAAALGQQKSIDGSWPLQAFAP